MSHKATSWLSTIPATQLGHSEFRVLFHLCDCHNPSQGCFPTQAYLMELCGVSNSTLNVALASLEAKGMIRRHQSVDERTRRQRPTRYMLGFEMGAAQGPSPKTGDGKSPDPTPKTGGGGRDKPSPKTGAGRRQEPSPKTGGGADSDLDPEPTPISRQSRLRPAGDKPVIEPVTNLRASADARARGGGEGPETDDFWAEKIRGLGFVSPSAMRPDQARAMLASGKVRAEDLKRHGIAF